MSDRNRIAATSLGSPLDALQECYEFLGRSAFADAVANDEIRLDGPPDLLRGFPRWLGRSRFAKDVTARPEETVGARV